MAKIQEVLPAESSSTDMSLEQVQNNDEKNVFANERQHSEKNSAECTDERAALANLTLDTKENKTILKKLGRQCGENRFLPNKFGLTQQNLPQNRKQAEIHSNVLKPGMYRIATTITQNREPQLPHASRNTNPHISKSSGVNHTTSVSRP
ncbi:hypothetical protein Tco_0027596 [Tanacetum coccineum]